MRKCASTLVHHKDAVLRDLLCAQAKEVQKLNLYKMEEAPYGYPLLPEAFQVELTTTTFAVKELVTIIQK